MKELFHLSKINLTTKHFGRTIEMGQMTGKDFSKSFNFQVITDQSDFKKLFKQIDTCINISKDIHLNRIKEIYSIEKEKLYLRDSKKVTEEIFEKEVVYNVEREKLLSFSFQKLQKVRLVVNPLVNIYQSNWKWCDSDPFHGIFDLKKIMITEKDDHYFLLEKTGTFDVWLDSNVSEYYLTEYQYFLLQLFEEGKKVKDVLFEFIQVFEVTNAAEKKELFVITERLIKELIFRRFIIKPNVARF